MSRPVFTLYSRHGCHLCEQLVEELMPLVRGRAELEIRDIDADAGLAEAYGTRVPVLAFDGRELCCYRLDRAAVMSALDT